MQRPSRPAFNMAWHYALDVRSEAGYFCEKTLRNYRRLFIEQGLDELLFRCLTDRMGRDSLIDMDSHRERHDVHSSLPVSLDPISSRSARADSPIARAMARYDIRRRFKTPPRRISWHWELDEFCAWRARPIAFDDEGDRDAKRAAPFGSKDRSSCADREPSAPGIHGAERQ